MSNPSNIDQLVRLSSATKIVERITGDRVHAASIHRWCSRGLKGQRLQTAFAGGHRRTCERWIREFFDAVTKAADGGQFDQAASSPADLERRVQAAEQQLQRRA